jgi:hydrogenase maturation protein HypF
VAGRRIELRGVVQGVGVRPWVYGLAIREGLTGHVCNTASGVTIDAFGSEEALDRFTQTLGRSAPPAAVIRELLSSRIPAAPPGEFRIVSSEPRHDRRVSIPPDLPTCDACLAELFDTRDRRYRYPFINCTRCGPRFTITCDVPYDRPSTTMAKFRMCEACQREYDDPGCRRFHAQPNACPVCGPRLQLVSPDGARVDAPDLIAAAAAALKGGLIVAIKGIGGFHLACDATSSRAVTRLRARKRRDEKPFAVMVATLDAAAEIATLTTEDRWVLDSPEHPIVLVARRTDSALTPEVAPGNPLVGVLLPYTPLHHLLIREVGRPIVMTSGNRSDEPIASRNEDALARLGACADLFLMHDRDIETVCDDSVARVVGRRPVVLRRARGYVPRAIPVAPPFERPVLACGALLKNTVCIASGIAAHLGPHIGDLENLETLQAFEASVSRMERFLRVTPEVIAHDLHPDYLSTRYALARPEPLKIAVQHHHAHVASAMAEHGLPGPVIGVAFDGSGYGTDGTSWGSEVLLARYEGFERLATFRPIPLAGGDAAVRQPWRIALALVEDAYEGHAPLHRLRLFSDVPSDDLTFVRRMLASGVQSPLVHGCGRYFDGIGSLVLARRWSRYEGQIALEWNGIADPAEERRYGFEICARQAPWVVDFRPMVREIVCDLLAGVPAPVISARFHNTIVAATAQVIDDVAREHGMWPVVLTGGCFQNARLTERLMDVLSWRFDVRTHRAVPPGDGGLALGQAVVAAAVARRTAD